MKYKIFQLFRSYDFIKDYETVYIPFVQMLMEEYFNIKAYEYPSHIEWDLDDLKFSTENYPITGGSVPTAFCITGDDMTIAKFMLKFGQFYIGESFIRKKL